MLIIGIAGGTGSGKTTIVNKIVEKLPQGDVAILPQDSYYRDNSHIPLEQRFEMNFDHPDSVEFELLIKHLEELKQGNSIEQPTYSYLTCTRSQETIKVAPCKIIIVEGILVLGNIKLREMMNLKVFVDVDADDRLLRLIKRDIKKRGLSFERVMEKYVQTVKPMHEQFIEPTKKFADIIVPKGSKNDIAVDILSTFIGQKLNDKI